MVRPKPSGSKKGGSQPQDHAKHNAKGYNWNVSRWARLTILKNFSHIFVGITIPAKKANAPVASAEPMVLPYLTIRNNFRK
jgi:hypothetical protein